MFAVCILCSLPFCLRCTSVRHKTSHLYLHLALQAYFKYSHLSVCVSAVHSPTSLRIIVLGLWLCKTAKHSCNCFSLVVLMQYMAKSQKSSQRALDRATCIVAGLPLYIFLAASAFPSGFLSQVFPGLPSPKLSFAGLGPSNLHTAGRKLY